MHAHSQSLPTIRSSPATLSLGAFLGFFRAVGIKHNLITVKFHNYPRIARSLYRGSMLNSYMIASATLEYMLLFCGGGS